MRCSVTSAELLLGAAIQLRDIARAERAFPCRWISSREFGIELLRRILFSLSRSVFPSMCLGAATSPPSVCRSVFGPIPDGDFDKGCELGVEKMNLTDPTRM